MSDITVEEWQLLSFFEAEPVRAEADIPWPYNDFSYRVVVGDYAVVFGIAPAYRDLSLSVSRNGMEIYSLTGLSVDDVRYHKDADREALEIVVSGEDSIWIRLRPDLLITQRSGDA